MKLVDNAAKWYKMFSVQAQLLQGALLTTWLALPAKFQETLPENSVMFLGIILVILGVLGRLVDQPSVNDRIK